MKVLQKQVEAINLCADNAVDDNKKVFTELLCTIQKRSCDVKWHIRSQQQPEVRQQDRGDKLGKALP